MTDKDAPAELFQSPRRIGAVQVRARHFVPQGQQHFGNTAHPRSPDSDQVNLLRLAKHRRAPYSTNR